jgi:hypothetical protein
MVQRLPMILKILKKRLIMSMYKAAAQSMALSTVFGTCWALAQSSPMYPQKTAATIQSMM